MPGDHLEKALSSLPQHEDPEAAMRIALWKARTEIANDPGSKVGGARILNFRKGWAMAVFNGGVRAHWFDRSGEIASSLCNAVHVHAQTIHGPGNYERCTLCIRKMTLMIRRGEM